MGATQDIRSLLETRLASLPACPSVAWEGVPFTPKPGETFFRIHLIPGSMTPHEMGPAGSFKYTGIFQITIGNPSTKGTRGLGEWADTIATHFQRFREVRGQTALAVSAIETGPVLPDEGWLYLPVSIRYYAFSTF